MFTKVIESFIPSSASEQNDIQRKSDICLLVIALLTVSIASFIFLYDDLVDMVCNSNLLLQSVFTGRLRDFYTYTMENSWSSFPANYSLPIYLIFAIWNLPMVLLFNFKVNGFVYLWFKLLIVLCVVACACLMYRVYILYDQKKCLSKGSFLLMLLVSPLVFLSEFVAGQYDCIAMILILAALYEYIRENDKLSLLLFCLAIPIKSFAIFLFFPLLAYREKSIFKILLKSVCVFILPLFCGLMFKNDPAYAILTGSQARDAAELILNGSIVIGNIEIHVFILIYLLLCYFCYFQKYDKSKVLWISAVVYTSFVIFVPIRSYWVFLAEPFLILLITTKPKHYKVSAFIHTVAQISGSLFFLYFHGIYNSKRITRQLVLYKLFDLPSIVKYGSFKNFVNVHGWGMYVPLLRTVFVGSCLALLLINAYDSDKIKLSSSFSSKVLLWIKSGVTIGIICIMVFVETYPCSQPVIDTLDYSVTNCRPHVDYTEPISQRNDVVIDGISNTVSTSSVIIQDSNNNDQTINYYSADINSGAMIEQPFEIIESRDISEIYLQFCNTDETRWNRGRLRITVLNKDTGVVLTESVIGTAMIASNNPYILHIHKTTLEEGNYILRITNIETPRSAAIYAICNLKETDYDPAAINGQVMEYPVCICIN